MCTSLCHTMRSCEIMREMFIIRVTVKTELQNFHSGVIEHSKHFAHFGSNKAQIFSNNIQFAQLLLNSKEQIFVRAFSPFALNSVCISIRNGIVAFEPSEMVNSNHII